MKAKTNRRAAADARQPELAFTAAPAPAPPRPAEDFAPLDVRFADLLVRLNGTGPHELLARAARGVSAARAAGETCLPLTLLGEPAQIREALLATKVVGRPGAFQPLILDAKDRLYLHRYFEYEQRLAAAIAARLQTPAPKLDQKLIATALTGETEGQRAAVELALRSNFCVITGGPGTGKTRTVGVLIGLLEKLAAAPPRIVLAAPTGKAAMRLQDSIRAHRPDALPLEAFTLHRLLGLTGESPHPRHDARNPLLADAVIIDEASMLDLAMMAKLVAAVPPAARLILLGDKDQLPPVETGNVLGELCTAPAVASRVAALHKNFRFGDHSGIKLVAEAIQNADADGALAHLSAGALRDFHAAETPAPDGLHEALRGPVLKGFEALFKNLHDPAAALAALGQFRILCALREGPYGVENLNRLAETVLAEAGRLQLGARNFAGRPIMVLRNDYQLRLFNGDIGLVLPDATAGGDLRAFFVADDGALRRLSPARLPEHETAWAMTVHKSQGSEFQRVLLVLPQRETPVVTRELIYTGLTRARAAAELWYRPGPLRAAISTQRAPTSGLADAITEKLHAR
jgi:exodeoxyribonuclease V alpha subunit